MAARAIWKGIIRLGTIALPVKFYAAVEDRRLHFRLLHEKDHAPLAQRMVHPRTGETVPPEEARRGYAAADGTIVPLGEEELNGLDPEPSRDIVITRVLPSGVIAHHWYDRPYYLGLDADADRYFALTQAFENQTVEGLARWTMRKKTYIGALRSHRGFLEMITLRFADEVVDAAELPKPSGRPFEKQELRMAKQLIKALAGEFDPGSYHDAYRDRVRQFLEAKARGGPIEINQPAKRRTDRSSLSELLKQSVDKEARERKSA